MVARARIKEGNLYEFFHVYRHTLRNESRGLKKRLRGTTFWTKWVPYHMKAPLPKNAKIFERDKKTGRLVQSKLVDGASNKKHYVLFPPYVRTEPKPKRVGRLRRAMQRRWREAREAIHTS